MLDVLHYFNDEDQQRILTNIADALPPGGVAIIRDGLKEPNLRYWVMYCGEIFAMNNGWLKGEHLNFPRRELFCRAFPAPEFTIESRPLSGRLLNNHLFIVRRVA